MIDVGFVTVPLGIIGGWFLSVAIHELGHAVAARMAGVHVIAVGIGIGYPLWKIRIGRIYFFVARRCYAGGVTFMLYDSPRPPRAQFVIATASGVAANLALCCVTGLLCFTGWANSLIASSALISAALAVPSAIPMSVTTSGMTLPNDAMLILHVWRGQFDDLLPPGLYLDTMSAFREICQALGAMDGVVHSTLAIAYLKLVLDDREGAKETLADPLLANMPTTPVNQHWKSYVQSVVQLIEEPEQSDVAIQRVAAVYPDNPDLMADLWMIRASIAIDREQDACTVLRQADELAAISRNHDAQLALIALRLEYNRPEDLYDQCLRMLNSGGSRQLPRLSALRLSCAATRILVERGEIIQARRMFQHAMQRLNEIASTISLDTTRERFQSRASAPLTAALVQYGEGPPLFIPDKSEDTLQRRARSTAGHSKAALVALCLVLFWLGVFAGSVLMVAIEQLDNRLGRRKAVQSRYPAGQGRVVPDVAPRQRLSQ